jgi:hypothetical protein
MRQESEEEKSRRYPVSLRVICASPEVRDQKTNYRYYYVQRSSSGKERPGIMDSLQKQRAESVVKAHIGWFQDLRKAVETGHSDLVPAVVAEDTECEFGKWVHSELRALCPADLFKEIKGIHAGFHRTAAAVLTLALNGRQADARARLGSSSELGELSRDLIQKVNQLR